MGGCHEGMNNVGGQHHEGVKKDGLDVMRGKIMLGKDVMTGRMHSGEDVIRFIGWVEDKGQYKDFGVDNVRMQRPVQMDVIAYARC